MPFDIIKITQRDLERYQDGDDLKKDAVPYQGQLKQHKNDEDKVFLLLDPLSNNSSMLEFQKKDVLFAEELKSISGDGQSYMLAKIWLKKGAMGIKLEPFVVSDLAGAFKHY